MNRKKTNKIILLIIILVTLFVSLLLYFYNKPGIDVTYNSEYLLGEPHIVNIETKNNFKNSSPDKLDIHIYNKYNKDVSLDKTLTPYSEGHYSLVLTPEFAGDYIVNIDATFGEETVEYDDSFNIQ